MTAALDDGAVAAVAGTRFLPIEESHAHPDYKQRCLDASQTILTELLGLGWPDAPHRVIPNGATCRWLRGDPRGPRWIRAAYRFTAPLASRIPTAVQDPRDHNPARVPTLPRAAAVHRRRPSQPSDRRCIGDAVRNQRNIYASVVMVAEKAADLIRGDTPLAPADISFYGHEATLSDASAIVSDTSVKPPHPPSSKT